MTDKNDHLIQTYRKRRDEFHVPLREGSWEKLEAELPSHTLRRRPVYRWIAVAAVIFMCIAISIPFLINKHIPEITENIPPIEIDKPAYHEEPQQNLQEQPILVAAVPTPAPIKTEKKKTEIEKEIEIEPEKETEKETERERETEIKTKKEDTLTGPIQEDKQDTNKKYALPERTRQKQDWSFGVSAGSNNANSSSTEYIDNSANPKDPPYTNPKPGESDGEIVTGDDDEDPENPDDPDSKASYFPQTRNKTETVRHKYHHRLPISIGLSARKNITDNFALESGLTYTYLYSDISKEGISGYIGSQKLHYLGIPVKANWSFYNQGRFSIYLSGGALFEYCIAARKEIEHKKEDIDINRFQASLTAAVGAQVSLVKPLSLFIEPGVVYYFDNGSDIETIRTDKPFMFNLNMGVRFTY